MPANTVCHIEIQTTDFARSRAFYEAVFAWKFREFGDEMVVFGTGDDHVGGLIKVDRVEPGRSPQVWIEVEDVDAILERVVAAGGEIASPKSMAEHVGFTAELRDPEGTVIGIVQFVRAQS